MDRASKISALQLEMTGLFHSGVFWLRFDYYWLQKDINEKVRWISYLF